MNEKGNSLTDEVMLSRLRSFCSYQERSESDLLLRMKKWQLPEKKAVFFISKLKEEGFLDEKRFARSFSEGKLRLKGWGKLKVRQALRQKGIDEESVNAVLNELDAEEYEGSLEKTMKKKAATLKAFPVQRQKQKLITYLLGKGFEIDLILKKINAFYKRKPGT